MIFLYIFTFLLIVATIMTIYKKKYIYFLFPAILFLPTYYAIDISASLPLLTASRLMLIIFYIYAVITYHNEICINIKKIKITVPTALFASYFLCRTISSLYYITSNKPSLKALIFVFFEDFLLLLFAYLINLSKTNIVSIIKCIVFGAAILYILGIFESFTGFRVFDYLYTAVLHRPPNEHYIRMGLMRATVTIGVSCTFGSVTLVLFPLVMFMYNYSRKKIYLFIAELNVYATIHSGTRSSQMFLMFIVLITGIIHAKDYKRLKLYVKNVLIISAALLVLIVILSSASERYSYYYSSSLKSIMNEVGFNFDLSKNVPSGVNGYGTNPEGTLSRTRQFSAVPYALSHNALFGMGYDAFWQGKVPIIVDGVPKYGLAIDVGVVLILINEGIIGLLGFICLFTGLVITTLGKMKNSEAVQSLNSYLLIMIIAYMLSTLTSIKEHYRFFLFTLAFLIVANNKTVLLKQDLD